MEAIIRGLYVGSDEDVPEAEKRGYSILTCAKDGPYGHRAMLGYTSLGAPKGKNYLFTRKGAHLSLNLIDTDCPTFIPDKVLDAGIEFIKEQIDAGHKVLVHCNQGKSRGPSIALLYLLSVGEVERVYTKALKVFKTLYPPYEPAQGMECKVRERCLGR